MTKAFCTFCQNDGSNEVHDCIIIIIICMRYYSCLQFRDVELEQFPILYCSLGKAFSKLTISELLFQNHRLNEVIDGPKDRYTSLVQSRIITACTSIK